jgi:hypothetical protein
LRIKYQENIEVTFVCSKAKVASLKHLSIPRLELQAAAVLGARMWNEIVKEMVINILSTHFSLLHQFHEILGIILEITESTHRKWTKENVADDATRDSSDINFGSNSKCFQGTLFLRTGETT